MQISKFYTFYDFNYRGGYPPFRPLIQYQLKRSIEYLVNLYPNRDRTKWVNYFVEIIQNSSYSEWNQKFAYWHLLAYLDLDRCYLIWRNFRKFPFYGAKSSEFYDLTNNLLFQPDKFNQLIDKYNAGDVSGANLKTYILGILRNAIREKLNLKSSWRTLCDVDLNSLKKFDRALQERREALERYGVIEPDRSRYIFALRHFIKVYKTNQINDLQRVKGKKWPEPKAADFAEVANYYNSQRFTINAPLQAASGLGVTPEVIKRWMNICIQALRYHPRIMEITYDLNTYEQLNSESNNFWQLKAGEDEPIELLLQADITLKKTIHKIEDNFGRVRSKIPQQFRPSIMPLCYSHPFALLNQEKLGDKIGVHQGTISRYINKHFETPLLNKFQQFANDKINLESYLTAFLEKRFTNPQLSNLLDAKLIEAIYILDRDVQQILKLRYSQKMSVANIARILSQQKSKNPQEIDLILVKAKNKLRKRLLKQLDRWQAEFVKLWLKKYYHEMIQAVLLNSFKELNWAMQEILIMRYCQKMDEQKIISFYPDLDPTQIIEEAKQHLQYSLLYWVNYTLYISLASERTRILEMVEDWLSKNLIYIEPQIEKSQ